MGSKLYVHIDESGDPGFNFAKGSSRFFVIAAIITKEKEHEKIENYLQTLKNQLHFKQSTEFKFRKTRKDVREKFFKQIIEVDFKAAIICKEKTEIKDKRFTGNARLFYNSIILDAIRQISKEYKNRKLYIVIDGQEKKTYRKTVKTYIRKNSNTEIDLSYHDSKDDLLIQLADMVAGAVSFSKKTDIGSDKYVKSVKKKIITPKGY